MGEELEEELEEGRAFANRFDGCLFSPRRLVLVMCQKSEYFSRT